MPTPEEQDECSVREYRQLVLMVSCMSEAHTVQRVPSCTETRPTRNFAEESIRSSRKGRQLTNQAKNPVMGTVASL